MEQKRENRQRILMMIFGALAIFFTGYPHIWSIYQPYVVEITGWSKEQCSMCFYLAMAFFVFGNITGGRLQDRYSPKAAISIGGGVFAAGILLSAFALLPTPALMYVTYGVMQGFGQGMIYTTIISTAQKWFPGKAGLSSGIIVTANGLCGFFLTPVSRFLLSAHGLGKTFLMIGTCIGISWILAWIFVQNPKDITGPKSGGEAPAAEARTKQYTSKEMIRTGQFYLLLFTMMFGLISYLMISPLAAGIQIDRGVSRDVAAAAVMLGSVCNALSRLILPTIADKKGRIACVKGVLIVSALSMTLLVFAPGLLSTVAIVLLYGCYGGIMGNFPSLSSSLFGLRNSGENYGFVMIGIVAATFTAPAVTALAKGWAPGSGFLIGACFAFGAVCFLILLDRTVKKRSLNG